MDLVKKAGSLLLHHEINDIIAKTTLLIKEIPEHKSLKLNIDLCVYVLNLVESGEKQEARCRRKCSNDNDKGL